MLTLEKFEEASEIVKKVTLETKLVYSSYLSQQTGNRVYLKPENMQMTGAYKLRGAYAGEYAFHIAAQSIAVNVQVRVVGLLHECSSAFSRI